MHGGHRLSQGLLLAACLFTAGLFMARPGMVLGKSLPDEEESG